MPPGAQSVQIQTLTVTKDNPTNNYSSIIVVVANPITGAVVRSMQFTSGFLLLGLFSCVIAIAFPHSHYWALAPQLPFKALWRPTRQVAYNDYAGHKGSARQKRLIGSAFKTDFNSTVMISLNVSGWGRK